MRKNFDRFISMTKLAGLSCTAGLLMMVAAPQADADFPVRVLPQKSAKYSDDTQFQNIVKKDVMKKMRERRANRTGRVAPDNEAENYREAQTRTFYKADGTPDYMIVNLLHKKTYSADTVRVNLDKDGNATTVETDYAGTTTPATTSGATYGTCPDSTVDMVFATMHTEISSAVESVDHGGTVAKAAGYNAKVIKGSGETVQTTLNWLSCPNLIFYYRVGHGAKDKIIVKDGDVTYTAIQNLGAGSLNEKLILFNSCQTHNSPLEPAVATTAGAQKYIAGDTDLMIGPSEDVSMCIMTKVLTNKSAISTAMKECAAATSGEGTFAISGTGSDTLTAKKTGGGTTEVCDSTHPTLCTTQATCTAAGLNWCNNACQTATCPVTSVCDSAHPTLCTTQATCTAAGLNWCNNACQTATCPVTSVCDSGHPTLCTTQATCTAAGLNWCNNACQTATCTTTPTKTCSTQYPTLCTTAQSCYKARGIWNSYYRKCYARYPYPYPYPYQR